MSNKEFDNTNRGTLFVNEDKKKLSKEKDTSKWADYQGTLNVFGVEFWISGWVNKIKKGDNAGKNLLSLQINLKNDDDNSKAVRLRNLIEKEFMNNSPKQKTNKKGKVDLDQVQNETKEIEDDDLPFIWLTPILIPISNLIMNII